MSMEGIKLRFKGQGTKGVNKTQGHRKDWLNCQGHIRNYLKNDQNRGDHNKSKI